MGEQIKMLFGVNTPWGPWNIVLHGGPDHPQTGVGCHAFLGPPCVLGTAEAGALRKTVQNWVIGGCRCGHVTYF